ncbi:MAG: hypothetical protein KA750_00530, partial [Thermoflexales bacterium]|nr:hypothetical protein [Thermoflexales bacterium]
MLMSIGVILLVGFVSYALGQAELTVVLSLLTLFASLRFQTRRVYLIVLAAHVATAYGVMAALSAVPMLALIAATASVLLYAELSFCGARSRER